MLSNTPDFLDPNRPDTVRLDVDAATALAHSALTQIGYPLEEARIITDQLIDNSLCGYRFAGLPRILAIARDAKTGATRRPIRIVHETASTARVDGGNNVGYVAVYRGMEIAIAKAKSAGVASVGVYDSYYSFTQAAIGVD
jgi:LDH2 family malate/lactate/ureidoglycolate dehydrogenase